MPIEPAPVTVTVTVPVEVSTSERGPDGESVGVIAAAVGNLGSSTPEASAKDDRRSSWHAGAVPPTPAVATKADCSNDIGFVSGADFGPDGELADVVSAAVGVNTGSVPLPLTLDDVREIREIISAGTPWKPGQTFVSRSLATADAYYALKEATAELAKHAYPLPDAIVQRVIGNVERGGFYNSLVALCDERDAMLTERALSKPVEPDGPVLENVISVERIPHTPIPAVDGDTPDAATAADESIHGILGDVTEDSEDGHG